MEITVPKIENGLSFSSTIDIENSTWNHKLESANELVFDKLWKFREVSQEEREKNKYVYTIDGPTNSGGYYNFSEEIWFADKIAYGWKFIEYNDQYYYVNFRYMAPRETFFFARVNVDDGVLEAWCDSS